MSEETKKQMLIVEDDYQLTEVLERLFRSYKDHVEIRKATNAGEALVALEEWRTDLLILDLMMPYGSAGDLRGEKPDPDEIDTGIHVLARIREKQEIGGPDLWVAVITARNEPSALREVEGLLCERGRLFVKPANSLALEGWACRCLGIECKLPDDLVAEALGEAST